MTNPILTAALKESRKRHPSARIICDLLMAMCGPRRDGGRPWLRLVKS